MKKILCVLLAMLMLLTVTACGNGGNGGSGDDAAEEYANKYADRPRTVTLCYYEGGYGIEWLRAAATDYMENVNTEVYISLKASTDNSLAREKIGAQTGTYDMYYIEVDMFNKSGVLEELTGLLDMEVPGEAGVKVRDKIDQRWIDYYTEDGKIYQMPATNMMGWNWTYNKDLLDETLGEGNWKLPNTTEEFFTLGQTLFDHSVFLTAFAGQDTTGGADYLRYCYEIWFAQMTGLEGYNHYFSCEYDTGSGYELAKDAPKNVEQNRAAIEATYEVAQTLCQGRKGAEFMHAKSLSLNFVDAQYLLSQGDFGGTAEYPVAFYYNTGAAEIEMQPHIELGMIDKKDIRVMKMPVISAIIERTPSITDDTMLSSVVDYVDGKGELPAGVTEEDAAIVAEARNMMAELVCREFVITKSAQNKDDIKNFMAYLTSDRAQLIAAQNCNGLPALNYGYQPTEEEMGFAYSEFSKSIYEVLEDAVIVDLAKFDKPAGIALGMAWYQDTTVSGGTLTKNLYTKQALTADKIYESTYNGLAGTWVERMNLYLAAQEQ